MTNRRPLRTAIELRGVTMAECRVRTVVIVTWVMSMNGVLASNGAKLGV